MVFKNTDETVKTLFDKDYRRASDTQFKCDMKSIKDIRGHCQGVFFGQGYPNRKDELWKYTSLEKVAKTPFVYGGSYNEKNVLKQISRITELSNSLRFVFVNGHYQEHLSDSMNSLEEGVSLSPLSSVFRSQPDRLDGIYGTIIDPEDSFTYAMNTGFSVDGLLLHVAKGIHVKKILHIISIGSVSSDSISFHPRLEFVLEGGATATVIESHSGCPGDVYMSNSVSEVKLFENSRLEHYTLVTEEKESVHIGCTAVSVGKNAFYNSFVLVMGGGLVRREIDVGLHSPGARATVDGIYCIADKSHSDIVSEVKHIGVESVSKQDVRGVLGGTSRGIFQGKVYVDSGAQGSDGDQLHRALFLNRGPEVNVKPQLEIFADDVKCSHGATTGELDSKHLFYLLSRGIDEPTARALLISGFINDVSMNIQNKEVCALVLGLTNQWLNNEVNLKPVLYD